MPVDFDRVPAETAPFLDERFQILNGIDGAVLLDFVVVNDGADALQLVMGAGHGSLPDGTFLEFPVTQKTVCLKIFIQQPCAQRDTVGDRQALA